MPRNYVVTVVRQMATPKPFMLTGIEGGPNSGGDAASAVMVETVVKLPSSPQVIPAYAVGLRRISRFFLFPINGYMLVQGSIWPQSRSCGTCGNYASVTFCSVRQTGAGATNGTWVGAATAARFYGLFIGD
jgi:hypothetical protein